MKKFGFMDPEQIMAIVVSLVILGVGIFAFFTVISNTDEQWQSIEGVSEPIAGSTQSSENNATWYEIQNATGNVSGTGDSVFNVMGIVLIIGAIMTIVGLIYSYVKPY